MISEAALTLIDIQSDGRCFTPGGVMAGPLVARLEAHAGLKFAVEN